MMRKTQLAALFLAGSLWATPMMAHAQERVPENTILVTGTGAVTARPDAVQLQVGVETTGKTSELARNANAEKMNAVITRIKGLNIPHLVLQTSGFSIYPTYNNEDQPRPYATKQPPQIIGYTARNTLNVKIEGGDPDRLADDASRIIDTAVASGANNTSGPNFYLSRNNKYQDDALRLAIQQARHNAEIAAEAAGVKLTGVFTIETYSQPVAMRTTMASESFMGKAAGAPTPIESGDMDVTANVTIRYDFQD